MRYFIDTHDKAKGTFPTQALTEEQFFAQFDTLDEAAHAFDVVGHAAHVNLEEGKAFCGIGAQVSSMIMEHCFDDLDGPVRRITAIDAPSIYSKPLEQRQLPRPTDVIGKVLEMLK